MSDPIISFRNVTKRFADVRAVNDVSFDIERGEFFSLLGPSGCGKTTLLRMLAGFEAPTSGEVYLDGQPLSGMPPNLRPVNMVFQSYAIFPHLDVRSNIAFGMRKSGLSRVDLDAKIDEMLELIKLPGYGARGANELSGGQRQRIALARALIKRPKVLLLDEPLGALDKKLREQMQIELRVLQQQVGITFVFVTHDQEEALTLSDRIAVMSKGDVLEIESPAQLYEAPHSHFVADFIGTMNFFKGTMAAQGSNPATVSTDVLGEIACNEPKASFAIGTEIMVGIRPEKLQLTAERPQGKHDAVEGRMGPSAYLGDRSHFYVYLDGRDDPVAVALQNIDLSMSGFRTRDKTVWLSWSRDAVVLLPMD